jgi:hypothetical protein
MEVAGGGDYDGGGCDSRSDNKTTGDFPPDEKNVNIQDVPGGMCQTSGGCSLW